MKPLALLCLTVLVSRPGAAQVRPGNAVGPVIDTVVVTTGRVFTPEQASSFAFRAANAIHITTKPWVIRQELLFAEGDTLDLKLLQESERNLRRLAIFRLVQLDTLHRDGRFTVLVHTEDAWSTNPIFKIAGSGRSLTLTAGLAERNLLGTGNFLRAVFFKEVDRTGVELLGNLHRIGRTPLAAGGSFRNLSDGRIGNWQLGVPYRAFLDTWGVGWGGESGDQRILRFRQDAGAPLDTTFFQRNVLRNRVGFSLAALHSSDRFLRLGVLAEIRRESYRERLVANPGPPDTTFGAIAAFARYRRAKFTVGRYWQGFGQQEDLDLSTTAELSIWLAPSAAGYVRTGIGPQVNLRIGKTMRHGFMVAYLDANGLFTSAGLDSGRVQFRGTIGFKPSERQATFLHIQAGAQEKPPPGQEFDLGFFFGPRTFGAHALVGTRMIWGTIEHRVYRWDDLLGFLGVGFAGFVDYGGAWYPDQEARLSGNFGVGIRIGSGISSRAASARIDLGYRFGDGLANRNRLGIAFGTGFDFFTGRLAGGL